MGVGVGVGAGRGFGFDLEVGVGLVGAGASFGLGLGVGVGVWLEAGEVLDEGDEEEDEEEEEGGGVGFEDVEEEEEEVVFGEGEEAFEEEGDFEEEVIFEERVGDFEEEDVLEVVEEEGEDANSKTSSGFKQILLGGAFDGVTNNGFGLGEVFTALNPYKGSNPPTALFTGVPPPFLPPNISVPLSSLFLFFCKDLTSSLTLAGKKDPTSSNNFSFPPPSNVVER